MTRMDGRFLKPGSVPRDRIDPEVRLGAPDAGSVVVESLGDELLRRFMVVTWSEASEVEAGVQALQLHLVDLLGQAIPGEHVVRLTCDSQASMSNGNLGQVLTGEGSEDIIAQTDLSGSLEVRVTCQVPASILVAAGPTQLSPMLDCRASAELTFN